MLYLKLASFCTAVMWSGNALATGWFGCGSHGDLVCNFLLFNGLVGIVLGGIPISLAVFAGVYLLFRRRDESKLKRALLGALNGIVVFEVTVVVAGIFVPWGERKNLPVPEQDVSAMFVYVALLVASILYVRSRFRRSREPQPEA